MFYKHPHTAQVVEVDDSDSVRRRILEDAGFREATGAEVEAGKVISGDSQIGQMSQPVARVAPLAHPPIGGPKRPGEVAAIDRESRRWSADELKQRLDEQLKGDGDNPPLAVVEAPNVKGPIPASDEPLEPKDVKAPKASGSK